MAVWLVNPDCMLTTGLGGEMSAVLWGCGEGGEMSEFADFVRSD